GSAGFNFIVPTIREEMMRRTIPDHRSQMEIVPSRVESPAIGSACLVWYAKSGKMPKAEAVKKEQREGGDAHNGSKHKVCLTKVQLGYEYKRRRKCERHLQ